MRRLGILVVGLALAATILSACTSSKTIIVQVTPVPPSPTLTPVPPPETPVLLPTLTPVPPPTSMLAPTAIPITNRKNCDAIRGTEYLSQEERDWFVGNCLPPTQVPPTLEAPTVEPTSVPPTQVPPTVQPTSVPAPFLRIMAVDPPLGSVICKDQSIAVTLEYQTGSKYVSILPWGRDEQGNVGDLLYGSGQEASPTGAGTITFTYTWTGTLLLEINGQEAGTGPGCVTLCGVAAATGGLNPPAEQQVLLGCAKYYYRPF